MSPEKQNIAIAEVRGWKHIHYSTGGMGRLIGQSPAGGSGWPVPNYCGSLDAMLEVVNEVITETLAPRYNTELSKMCPNSWMFRTTAAQHAEAFLRTLGKWEDDK